MTKKLNEISIKDIEQDYQPDTSIWDNDTPMVSKIKNIIFNNLTLTERRIILIYSETASMREVGKRFGISTSKTYQLIQEIRTKIKNILLYGHTYIPDGYTERSGDDD